MAREVTADLATLLAASDVETASTLDLVYTDGAATERHWATASFSHGGTTYLPYLKKVGDIRMSLLSATDRVKVEVINNDSIPGADVASGLRYFDYAEAIVGRYYHSAGEGLEHRSELFRGRVMQPEVTESLLQFDVIDSLVAAGPVIASRPLTIKCPHRYKDPRTCGATSPLATCNKMLNSSDGCRGRNNTSRFGGWYFPFPTLSSAPSGGSSPGTPPRVPLPCFTGDTLVSMVDGPYDKPIRYVQPGDRIWSFYWSNVAKKDIIVPDVVEEVFVHEVNETFEFTFDDGRVLEVTAEHPLYVGKGAFLRADRTRLKQRYAVIDKALAAYGMDRRRVVKMRLRTDRPVTVFNLHVRHCHTYFANGIAVHNSKDPSEI
ncbi:MAG: Hint domain-containing protein [Pyrinomonadaceae bacterium]